MRSSAKPSKGTIIRAIVLAIALINQLLVAAGYSPLPINDENSEMIISSIFTAAIALITWWKNNSITPEAIEADKRLETFKARKEG